MLTQEFYSNRDTECGASRNWSALHAQFLRSATRYSFMAGYTALRRTTPELERFPDPVALFDWLHGSLGSHDEKNAVLCAMVAQLGESEARTDLVSTMLILALWPGLDAVYGRLLRHYRDAPHALASEISGRFMMELRRVDLERVRRVAATVIRNVERDINRDLRRTWARGKATVPIEGDDERLIATVPALSALDRILAVQVLDVLGDDAALVQAVAIEGQSQREAAEQLGISHDTARKKYQRALAKVRRIS